jgi:hypothetical protein
MSAKGEDEAKKVDKDDLLKTMTVGVDHLKKARHDMIDAFDKKCATINMVFDMANRDPSTAEALAEMAQSMNLKTSELLDKLTASHVANLESIDGIIEKTESIISQYQKGEISTESAVAAMDQLNARMNRELL